jgi:membrane protein YqaA with SNARE-associated domain
VPTPEPAEPRPAAPEAPGARPGVVSRAIYRLLARFHGWAESGWGGPAVGGWGFLQGSVMPGPTDTVLVPLGLSDPGRVFRLALWATLGATLGGLAAYGLGFSGGDRFALPLLERLGVSASVLARTESALAAHGWLVVALSTVSPLSSKAVCVAAGAFGVPLWQFLPALAMGRAARFFTIALVLRFAGPGLLDTIARRAGVRPLTTVGPA